MTPRYVPGQYSKNHLQEIQEICDLRHLYGMSCQGCVYERQYDCPKKQDGKQQELRITR
jgi:hypothetical protein